MIRRGDFVILTGQLEWFALEFPIGSLGQVERAGHYSRDGVLFYGVRFLYAEYVLSVPVKAKKIISFYKRIR